MLTKKITVTNPSGLHMRPAGFFVTSILPFKSEVLLAIRDGVYNCKSMLSILSAVVKCGDEIELSVEGADEQECMDAVMAAFEVGLGE